MQCNENIASILLKNQYFIFLSYSDCCPSSSKLYCVFFENWLIVRKFSLA